MMFIFYGDIIIVPIVLILISVIFFKVDKNENKRVHYFVGIHGVALAAAHIMVVCVQAFDLSNDMWFIPLYVLFVFFVLSMLYSLIKLKGNKIILFLHILTIPACLLIWFTGTMAITGIWL